MPKKYRQIILHAGLPKTGSTSIQDNCYQHRDVLLQNGLFYPSFSLGERRLLNHSDPLTALLFEINNKKQWAYRQGVMDSQEQARADFSRQFAQVFEQTDADRLLLSAEIVADYSDQDLRTLQEYLDRYTDDLRVLIFLRSPQSSVESILQQRAYGGGVADDMVSVIMTVRQRFEVLYRQFGDRLEVLDFHSAVNEPDGLVGVFLRALGLDKSLVSNLSFSSSNERISLEAYKLMVSINEQLPADPRAQEGYQRKFHDLKPLTLLPGAPFQLDHFKQTAWYKSVLEEASTLTDKYGYQFPDIAQQNEASLWGNESLIALEDVISRLETRKLREAAASCLEAEAGTVTDPATASILGFISQRVRSVGDTSAPALLESIGADYFKFAALQVGTEAPRLALQLMSLAQTLRPQAEFIAERIRHYRSRVKK